MVFPKNKPKIMFFEEQKPGEVGFFSTHVQRMKATVKQFENCGANGEDLIPITCSFYSDER